MKYGQLSRADLWDALKSHDQDTQKVIADSLGLYLKPEEQTTLEASNNTTLQIKDKEKPDNTPLKKSLTSQLTTRYWQLVKQEDKKEDDDQPKKEELIQEEVKWRNRPKKLPEYPALIPLKECRSRVLPILNKQLTGRQVIDIAKLIDKVSRAEFIKKIPKKALEQSLQSLHLIDDRQRHLIPYWLDHGLLSLTLLNELASYQISRAVILPGETEPIGVIQNASDLDDQEDYQLPPIGTSVVIMSDLGRLGYGATSELKTFSQSQQRYWAFIQSCLKNHNPVIVISPCDLRDYPAQLQQLIQFIPWQVQTQNASDTKQSDSHWVELLLILASPCSRLEPEILRSLRVGLEQFGYHIPVAVESFVWQHASLKSTHSVAASFENEQRKKLRDKFIALDKELQAFAIKTIRSWRANIADEIWFMELLDIENAIELGDEYQNDLEDACGFLKRITQQNITESEQAEDYIAWFARQDFFMSKEAVKKGKASASLQKILSILASDSSQSPAGHIISPEFQKGGESQTVETLWICQKGNTFTYTRQHNPSEIPQQGTSLIAPVKTKNKRVTFELKNGDDRVSSFINAASDVLPLQNTQDIPLEDKLIIKTDLTTLTLKAIDKPAWASEMGRDAYGLYADIDFAKAFSNQTKPVIQRFRWIPAGQFMMGSPSDEPDRYEKDEDYHQVKLTQGYWLADTAVTQALWQLAMSDNPAKFKGENNPVEHVSWDDSQQLINQLHKQIGLLADLQLRLPTEAEWEYACRAGTKTEFSFGNNITSEQVNFNTEQSYNNGEKVEPRGRTVSVKSLTINPRGLYEMHGNVSEWCADAWKERLGELVVADPFYDKAGALRVVRGGSWRDDGRLVRSAFRYHRAPDYRLDYLGLRLSLGHIVGPYQEIQNPFYYGRPISPEYDTDLFRGREEVARQIERLIIQQERFSIALLAPRLSGKTSLLRMLPVMLPDAIFILYDLQNNIMNTVEGFFRSLVKRVQEQALLDRNVIIPDLPEGSLFESGSEWLKQVDKQLDQTMLLCIDEFGRLPALFPGTEQQLLQLMSLFDAIQYHKHIRLLVSVTPSFDESEHILNDYFTNVHEIKLLHLDYQSSIGLIRKPIDNFPKDAIPADLADALYQRSNGQPFLLQAFAGITVEHINNHKLKTGTLDMLDSIEEKVIVRCSNYFRYIYGSIPEKAKQILQQLSKGKDCEIDKASKRWLLQGLLITKDGEIKIPVFGHWVREYGEDV